MESFQIDGLRVFNPVKGSFMLVKNKTSSEDSAAEANADTTTITTSDGSKITRSRHHDDSDGFPIAVVPALAITFTFVWLIVKAVMAPFTQRAGRRNATASSPAGLSDEEQAVLVKLQRTLVDMEQRIESLETILINDHRAKENYGTKI